MLDRLSLQASALGADDLTPLITRNKPLKLKNNVVKYLHGDGCKHSKACFDCPLPDCIWQSEV